MAVDGDLRPLVNGLYDLQKVRISIGNRIVANFHEKLGIKSDKELKDKAKAKKVIDKLRLEYDRITDGIVRITQKSFKPGKLIGTMAEAMMIRQYNVTLESELQLEKDMAKVLETKQLWSEYLLDIKGVGTKIASYIMAYIDIYKAEYPSSLHAYCGLDVVKRFYLIKNRKHARTAPKMLQKRHPDGYVTKGPAYIGPGDSFKLYDETGKKLLGSYKLDDSQPGEGAGRSRRKEHLRTYKYIAKDGEEKEKDGITFRGNLKTKLVGVLGPSLLKCKNDRYYTIYLEYKARLESDDRHKEKIQAHRHNMAVRYMIKQFLTDLYVFWREMEDLPVSKPFAEAKFGPKKRKAA